VAGPPRIGFLDIEGLRNKLGNNDFLALLAAHDVFGITESWAGFEKSDVRGYVGYVKGRGKIAKFGLKAKTNSDVVLCMGFIYNALQNSRYNPNFTLELEEEVNLMRDFYPLSEILIMREMNSRIGDKHVSLPHTWDPYCEAEKMDYDLCNSRSSKDKC
jgi:hypothetical protein